MRIDAFLKQSPIFAVNRASRKFDSFTAYSLGADGLSFLEGLILAATFFEEPRPVKPSQLAEAFSTARGNVSHCLSTLEGKGLLSRKIDPADARAYQLVLKPQGRKCALRVIRAYDRLQREFEKEIGLGALGETLKTLRKIEAVFSASSGPRVRGQEHPAVENSRG